MIQVLVSGGNGQLGRCLKDRTFFHPTLNCHFFDLPELDISDSDTLSFIIKELNIGAVVNAAAYTAVDNAETEAEQAFAVNAMAVGTLASLLRELDIPLIHISTDYVFDGQSQSPYKENDLVSPKSVYGKSKLAGENEMMGSGVDGLIIRTSWLYSAYGKNFLKTILRISSENDSIRVVNDQQGSPTFAGDLAEAVLTLIPAVKARKGVDVIHYANKGITTWHGFASEIVRIAGRNCIVKAITTGEFPVLAPRPKYSVLDTSKAIEQYGLSIPEWKDSLQQCMQHLNDIGT